MQVDPTKPLHFSINGRPLPDAKNTAWPWNVSTQTHYIIMPDGRVYYVRRLEASDIDALTSQEDLCAVAVYAAASLQVATHEGAVKCLKFVMSHATRRIAQAYQTNAPRSLPHGQPKPRALNKPRVLDTPAVENVPAA